MTDVSAPVPGEVYVFPVEQIGKVAACQVLAVDDEHRTVTVTVLDWVGDVIPEDVSMLAGVGRMVKNFMFWRGSELTCNVSLPVPRGYRRVGVLPVTGDIESNSYGGWDFDGEIARQLWWDSLPKDVTARFKASVDSDELVVTPGLVDPETGGPFETRLRWTTQFSDDARYTISDDFELASLRSWIVYQVALHAWRDDLLGFLEDTPLASDLRLSNHGQQVLDFSRTHLERLSVDVTGLRRLVLPATLSHLILHGTPEEPLVVDAAGRGAWLWLYLDGSTYCGLQGLENVSGLRIDRIRDLSMAGIRQHHPHAKHVMLFGAPGTLQDLPVLAALPDLESLWLCDLFGYTAHDFPRPDEFVSLNGLDLISVPVDVATWARRVFAKARQVELSVRKPRKPEWLAENLDNPLRHWDGRDGIPATVSTKASAAWRTAVKQVRTATGDDAIVEVVKAFLGVIRALNQKHAFLYTLECDEVIDAVNALTTGLSPEAQRALDPLIEEALD